MKITSIPDKPISLQDFVSEFKDRVEENEENVITNQFDKGYKNGYHDALIEVFNFFDIKHDEDFYN